MLLILLVLVLLLLLVVSLLLSRSLVCLIYLLGGNRAELFDQLVKEGPEVSTELGMSRPKDPPGNLQLTS